MMSLGLEAVAQNVPTVSFIHDFPGAIKTGIGKDVTGMMGILIIIMKAVITIMSPFLPSIDDIGDRHVFFATSAKYPPANPNGVSGVALTDGITVAKGIDGENGSGVYSLTSDGESTGPKVEKLLSDMRKSGVVDQLWQHTESEFKRITG